MASACSMACITRSTTWRRWRPSAARARTFGFDGKSVIHPSHLEICNRVFAPTPGELDWARAVVAAFAAPENAGRGALRVEGRLAEHLHLDQSRHLLAMADAIAAAGAG